MARSPSEPAPAVDPSRREGEQPGHRERQRQDELLDEALEETFPASDPIAPARIRSRPAT